MMLLPSPSTVHPILTVLRHKSLTHGYNNLQKRQVTSLPIIPSMAYKFKRDISRQSRFQEDDDIEARSQFGTKSYWDAMYDGMGDFSADEYSWYYGWETIKPYVFEYIAESRDADSRTQLSILVPGCGNDPLLLELFNAGFNHLTAFDYSLGAIERQRDLLQYLPTAKKTDTVELRLEDARALPDDWDDSFDVIIEKGALDAIYLSGDGNFERSAKEFARVLRAGGVCISVSGVVPSSLRMKCFTDKDWVWLRDGSGDKKAGCFVFKRV